MSISIAGIGEPQVDHRHQRLPAGEDAGLVAMLGEQATASSTVSGRT